MRVWDFEALAEDCAGFVLHQQQAAVGFVAGDLLHDVQEVDSGEEVAEGEDGDGFFGWWCGGMA